MKPSLPSCRFLGLAALLCLAFYVPAFAGPADPQLRLSAPERELVRAPLTPRVAAAQPSCSDGLIYDDGTLEDIVYFVDEASGFSIDADVVMRFDIGEAGKKLDQVCVCWQGFNGPAAQFNHQLIFYSADGPNGMPGTELAVLNAQAQGIPMAPDFAFFDYDISSADIHTTGNNIYVGVRWNGGDPTSPNYALCADTNGSGNQPMWASVAELENWGTLASLFNAQGETPPRSLLLRVTPGEDQPATCPTDPCVPDATTLCLRNDRFKVTTEWATVQNTSGQGMAGNLGLSDTGYFWFFNQNNVEMVVKVLNACSFADRFWVFAGGLTNVEVQMEVCDTQEGILQTYSNPQNTPFQPIQDTAAFATCP